MPTYAYRCEAGHQFEAVQGITEPALTSCTVCALPVRRVVFPVGIVFKGQGFYKNDSRPSDSGSTPLAKPDAKPAAATAAKPETGTTTSPPAVPKQESTSGGGPSKGKTA
ncbi:MAG: FmdB family zinc ribbon protein [Candidatus Dormibacteria bacterium]